MASLHSMLVGVLCRGEVENVSSPRFCIGLDVVRREPDGEFIRLHGEFLDADTRRHGREHLFRMLEPFIEGRLQVAVTLRESADTIKVVPAIPGEGDQIDGWLPLSHSETPNLAEAS